MGRRIAILFACFSLAIVFSIVSLRSDPTVSGMSYAYLYKYGPLYRLSWVEGDEIHYETFRTLQKALGAAAKKYDLTLIPRCSFRPSNYFRTLTLTDRGDGTSTLNWERFDSEFKFVMTFRSRQESLRYYELFQNGFYSPSVVGHALNLSTSGAGTCF